MLNVLQVVPSWPIYYSLQLPRQWSALVCWLLRTDPSLSLSLLSMSLTTPAVLWKPDLCSLIPVIQVHLLRWALLPYMEPQHLQVWQYQVTPSQVVLWWKTQSQRYPGPFHLQWMTWWSSARTLGIHWLCRYLDSCRSKLNLVKQHIKCHPCRVKHQLNQCRVPP